MKKLNLGCGIDYKEDFINIDFNRNIKADVYCDIEKEKLPFKDNSVSYVYCSHFLEHIKNLFKVMDEIWRVCKNGAIIEIFTQHYTGTHALKFPCHHNYFGIDTFIYLTENSDTNKERYCKARVKVLKEELRLFFKHPAKAIKHGIAIKVVYTFNLFNFFFNFGHLWKLLMEKLFLFGFEEIYYKLEVIKK